MVGGTPHRKKVLAARLERRVRRAERHVRKEGPILDPGVGYEALRLLDDGVGQIAGLVDRLAVAGDGGRPLPAHVPDVLLPEELVAVLDDAGRALVGVKRERFCEAVLLLETEGPRAVLRAVSQMPLSHDAGGVSGRAEGVPKADLAGRKSLPQPLLGIWIGVEKKRLHLVGVDDVAKAQVLAEVAYVALHGLRLEPEAVLVASGEQRRSGGRADGGRGVGAEELHPIPRQRVDVGGVRGGAAVRGQVVAAEIVGDDQQDVGAFVEARRRELREVALLARRESLVGA